MQDVTNHNCCINRVLIVIAVPSTNNNNSNINNNSSNSSSISGLCIHLYTYMCRKHTIKCKFKTTYELITNINC